MSPTPLAAGTVDKYVSHSQYLADYAALIQQLNNLFQMVRGSAFNSGGQAISSGTFTGNALTFDTLIYDNGSPQPVHSTSVNPSRFSTGQAGWHLAVGQVAFTVSAGGTQRQIRVRVNGVDVPGRPNTNIGDEGTVPTIQAMALVQLANATDYVEFYAFQDTGGNLNTVANFCWGSLTLLSRL